MGPFGEYGTRFGKDKGLHAASMGALRRVEGHIREIWRPIRQGNPSDFDTF